MMWNNGPSHLLQLNPYSSTILSIFFLLISSSTQVRFSAQVATGRRNDRVPIAQNVVNEESPIMHYRIGSKPPKCDRRCISCGRCQAIQVPTYPQINQNHEHHSTSIDKPEYARGDGNTNYKPMTWKCKCGDVIFNP